MSPLRRAWLAWGGSPDIVTVAVCQFLICAIQVVGELATFAGETASPSRLSSLDPFLGFFSLGPFLGLRLRVLLSNEIMALSQRHTERILLLFFLFILPITVSSIAIPSMLIGGAPVSALTNALCACALATWGVYIQKPTQAIIGVVLYVMAYKWLRPLDHNAWNLVASVLALGGCLLAWKRLLRHSWNAIDSRPLTTVFNEWLDRVLGGSRPIPRQVSKRLPTLTTAARNMIAHQRPWSFQIMCLLAVTIGCFWWARNTGNYDHMAIAYSIMTFSAFLIAMDWASLRRNTDGVSSTAMVRGLVASERLLPLSRTKGAAASLLALNIRIIAGGQPIVVGLILGFAAAEWSLGRTPDVLAFGAIVLYFLSIASVVAGSLIFLNLIPPWLAVCLLGLLFSLVLFSIRVLAVEVGWAWAPLVITTMLALVLVPLAWQRLSTSELP